MPFSFGSSTSQSTPSVNGDVSGEDGFDKSTISDLIAKYGCSSATAWLEFDRYKIWQPTENIPESSFKPVQGYMRRDPYVFAWGNPLVSDSTALEPAAKAFTQWAEEQDLQPVWSCVDESLEHVLGGPSFEWCTVSCIYEDVIDPAHVIDIVSDDGENSKEDGSATPSSIKDLKKNLRRAGKANVEIDEIRDGEWTDQLKADVSEGVEQWKKSKSGLQLASTTGQPWLDQEHRRYWVARQDNKIVGVLILTPIKGNTWQIKNAISFPDAPKGSSEALIHGAVRSLYEEQEAQGVSDSTDRVTVTFGTTAAAQMKPVENLSGWKVNALAKTYNKVAKGAGLLKRGDFRNKFDSEHDPMYVCYPDKGFGLDGVNALLKLLKK